jgi:hypothetical protein
VRVWDIYSAMNDLDLYVEWAKGVTRGTTDERASRAFAGGMIALRPDRDGKISGYEGVEAVRDSFSRWIIDAHMPPAGTPTQSVEAGYMANAWMRLRHPDYDELRNIMNHIGETVKVHAH